MLNPQGVYLDPNFLNSLTKLPANFFHQLFTKKRAKSFIMKQNGSDLKLITNWINESILKIKIDRKFSLNQISQAHEYSQKGHNKGKNIVFIQSSNTEK